MLYLVVPILAFANAGVVLSGLSPADFIAPVPLGIALGLIVGKQLGVFGLTYLLVKFNWAQSPHGANWMQSTASRVWPASGSRCRFSTAASAMLTQT